MLTSRLIPISPFLRTRSMYILVRARPRRGWSRSPVLLQLVLGDAYYIPFDPPVVSRKIRIIVT